MAESVHHDAQQAVAAVVDVATADDLGAIGRAIKAARQAHGLSLRALAGRAGLSASLLSAVETGKIMPTVASLFATSSALGVPPQALFPAAWQVDDTDDVAAWRAPPPPERDSPTPGIQAAGSPQGTASTRQIPSPVANIPALQDSDVHGAAASHGESLIAPPRRAHALRAQLPRRRPRPEALASRLPSAPERMAHGEDETDPASVDLPYSPSGDSLDATADPRGTPAADLSEGEFPSGVVSLIRAGAYPAYTLSSGMTVAHVMPPGHSIAEFVELTLPAKAASGSIMMQHAGWDIGWVLDGSARLELGFSAVILNTGDTIVFDAAVPHRIVAIGGDPARLLWGSTVVSGVIP